MVAVPADMPDTIPVLPTVATEALLLVQLPPGVISIKVVAAPAHTVARPVTEPAEVNGSTVTTDVVYVLPQLLLVA